MLLRTASRKSIMANCYHLGVTPGLIKAVYMVEKRISTLHINPKTNWNSISHLTMRNLNFPLHGNENPVVKQVNGYLTALKS